MTLLYASADEMNMPFTGAKIAILIADGVLSILRDDRGDIPFPGHWDLPGGGREGSETPLECAQRETREELGFDVPAETILWARRYGTGRQATWFFAARAAQGTQDRIVFGDEGQRWALMPVRRFLHHPRAVPAFQDRLRIFLDAEGDGEKPPTPVSGGR